MSSGRINESTIARMAGNIFAGRDITSTDAVLYARRIAAEVKRTEPVTETNALHPVDITRPHDPDAPIFVMSLPETDEVVAPKTCETCQFAGEPREVHNPPRLLRLCLQVGSLGNVPVMMAGKPFGCIAHSPSLKNQSATPETGKET